MVLSVNATQRVFHCHWTLSYLMSTQAIAGRQLSAIHTQQGQINEITVIAKGSDITIYVNQQYITDATDSTFSSGVIGVGAGYLTTSTEATFSNAKVWTL